MARPYTCRDGFPGPTRYPSPQLRRDCAGDPIRFGPPSGACIPDEHIRPRAPAALAAGADHVLVSSGGGFQDQVRELTGGRGTDVVYDGGGGTDTFRSSQLALRRHGVYAFYGNLIGNPTLNPTDLPQASS